MLTKSASTRSVNQSQIQIIDQTYIDALTNHIIFHQLFLYFLKTIIIRHITLLNQLLNIIISRFGDNHTHQMFTLIIHPQILIVDIKISRLVLLNLDEIKIGEVFDDKNIIPSLFDAGVFLEGF